MPYLAGFGSGVLATGGGLLFHGGTDGFFRAFDSKTGEELWRFQTGFGADAPAAAYEINGEQYVSSPPAADVTRSARHAGISCGLQAGRSNESTEWTAWSRRAVVPATGGGRRRRQPDLERRV